MAGSITSSTLVNATSTIDPLSLFQMLQNEINKLKASTQSVIYFSLGATGSINSPSFVGTRSFFNADDPIILIPVNGTISHLVARADFAAGVGESYKITVLKNGVDTSLTCTISNLDTTCTDSTHKVSVNAQDSVVGRIDSSTSSAESNLFSSVAFASR